MGGGGGEVRKERKVEDCNWYFGTEEEWRRVVVLVVAFVVILEFH